MKNNQNPPTCVILRTPINKSAILRRIPIALILIYYIWILVFAFSLLVRWDPELGLKWSSVWWWDPEQGLIWSSGGPGQFFPIPKSPGMLTVITPAYPHDQIFYLIFMHNWIWIIWVFLGLLFVSPYRINLRTLFVSIQTKLGFRKIT